MQTFNFALYNKETERIDRGVEVDAETLIEAQKMANDEFGDKYIIL